MRNGPLGPRCVCVVCVCVRASCVAVRDGPSIGAAPVGRAVQ